MCWLPLFHLPPILWDLISYSLTLPVLEPVRPRGSPAPASLISSTLHPHPDTLILCVTLRYSSRFFYSSLAVLFPDKTGYTSISSTPIHIHIIYLNLHFPLHHFVVFCVLFLVLSPLYVCSLTHGYLPPLYPTQVDFIHMHSD